MDSGSSSDQDGQDFHPVEPHVNFFEDEELDRWYCGHSSALKQGFILSVRDFL